MEHSMLEFKQIGKNIVPAIGFGTWGIGGWTIPDSSYDTQAVAAIKTAIESGMTHIDTAEVYAKGHAEELIAQAIKELKIPRKKLFITSKVWKDNLSYDGVLKSAEKSLQRLNTDYLDLYLIHWPNHRIPLQETMRAMDRLVEEGKVKNIGVSNFSLKQMQEAQSYTKNKIAANQTEYNLIHRDIEHGLLQYCQKNGIVIIAYYPLAQGKLSSPEFKTLREMAEKYHVTQAQIALNWLISIQNVITIPKSLNPEHVKENLGAMNWRMWTEDRVKLENSFDNYFSISDMSIRVLNKTAAIIHDTMPKQSAHLSFVYDKFKRIVHKNKNKHKAGQGASQNNADAQAARKKQ